MAYQCKSKWKLLSEVGGYCMYSQCLPHVRFHRNILHYGACCRPLTWASLDLIVAGAQDSGSLCAAGPWSDVVHGSSRGIPLLLQGWRLWCRLPAISTPWSLPMIRFSVALLTLLPLLCSSWLLRCRRLLLVTQIMLCFPFVAEVGTPYRLRFTLGSLISNANNQNGVHHSKLGFRTILADEVNTPAVL